MLAGAIASSLMLGGCGNRINQDDVVATMGDQEISLGYANFVAHYNQANYDTMLASYYGEGTGPMKLTLMKTVRRWRSR